MIEVRTIDPDGTISTVGHYTLTSAEAVVAASEQAKGNFNTWTYPKPEVAGVRFLTHRPDVAVLGLFYGFPPREVVT